MKRTQRARRQVQAAPVATPAAAKRPGVSHMALMHAVPAEHVQAFVVPRPLKGVVPKGARPLAMDDANSFGAGAMYGELMQSLYSEGLSFAGYPALAQMTQRAEYRRPAEILAKHMTRKWIRLQSKGDEDKTDKISKLEDEFERLNVQGVFRKAIELDGFFGRSQIYIDTGANFEDRDELMSPLALSKNKIAKGSLKALTVIEPVWTYPNQYNSTNPLAADFYQPKSWFVLGSEIHASRLMTIIGRQVPDMLKPAYAFGGLSLSQMAKPYVDNWLRTRQSVSDLIHSFSVSGLKTNLGSILQGGQGNDVANRVALFNQHRDNRGMMIVDKDTEEFFNVSTPLSGLDHLQAQSQEHMCLTRGTLIETSRGQVPIEEVTIYDYVMTRDGYAPVVWSGITKYTSDLVEVETDCSTLRSTPEHPIWSETKRDFVSAQNVDRSHRLLRSPAWESTASLSHGEVACGASQKRGISAIQKREGCSTASFTKLTSDLFRRALTFITTTKTQATTGFQTCASSRVRNMLLSMSREASPLSPAIAIASGAWNAATPTRLHGLIERFIALAHANRQGTESMCSPILRAQSNGSSASGTTTRSAAQASVKSIRWIVCDEDEPVYDITVGPGHLPEFYANGVLVHNSAVTGIPLSILLGITPTGLNASSEGEIRTFYDWIAAQQEGHITPFVEYVLRVAQLSLFGEIDPDIGFAWEPLWSMNAAEAATVRKTDADTDVVLINAGVISPEESRKRVAADEDSPYAGLDINDLPEPPQQQEGDPNGPPANADEPHEPTEDPDAPAPNQTPTVGADEQARADNGQFGSGGGSDHPDMAQINVPLSRRGNIDAQLDRYKADKAKQEHAERKVASATRKTDKAHAKDLFKEHGAALIEKHAPKFGRKQIIDVLDQMMKWEPKKFIGLVAKHQSEQSTKSIAGDADVRASIDEDFALASSVLQNSPHKSPKVVLGARDEHWITTENDTKLLISSGGVVLGGAGGNMNGITLSPSSKSAPRSEAPGSSQAATVQSALQNRNRNSAASIAQMNRIAANPNPRLLMAAPTMNDGAPVVSDLAGSGVAKLTGKRDYVVTGKREIPIRYAVVDASEISISNKADGTKNADYAQQSDKLTAINNGRTAGVVAAYERGTADAYKAALVKGEHVHGISGKAIKAMKAPVLVRIMDAADVDEHIGDESNSTQTLNLSAVEQAQNDAGRFDPAGIDYRDDGTPTDESVKGFINAMPEAERQSLSPNGRPTKQAIDRMMAATFHSAYGDTELVGLMAQATDPESRNLIGGMSRAAGSMAKLKDTGELDFRELVTGAAKQIINAVRSGVSIQKFLKQGDLLTSGPEDAIAAMFAQNNRSAKTIGERLDAAAKFAHAESQRGGVDMFGEQIPTASRAQVLEELHAHT